ncbi:MAG: hypothetical protein K5686_12160 [Lachnospiraceae bacterium]|nr:hypothetical protein [Lachnospiraceae bacterium]
MHVSVRTIALSGMLTALSLVCIFLGSVLEFNTAFLLVLAAFLIGTVAALGGVPAALCSFAATVILGCLLSPVKTYVLTFSLFVPYAVACEYTSGSKTDKKRAVLVKALVWWIWSAVCGFIFYLLAGVAGLTELMPEIMKDAHTAIKLGIVIAALAVAWVITDVAYYAYRKEINGRLRNIFNKEERK